MIILNLLNRIFGPREPLSREDISSYQEKKLAHDVEEKSLADDFNSDALDGWSESGFPIENMNDLDKKFESKFNTPTWSSSTLVFFTLFFVASGTILIFTYSSNKTNQIEIVETNKTKKQPVDKANLTVDQNSIQEEELINELVAISEEKEVQPSSLKRKPEGLNKEKTDTIEHLLKVDTEKSTAINPNVSENIPVKENSKTLVYNLVDEFYLYDFKLIDYRKFRDAPIKKRKLVPVGTPADQEYYDNENDEDFVWKDVDISYVDFLSKSMEYFDRSNYKKALKRYNTILETYEGDINAHFYGGLCYYNLGEYKKAIDHFNSSYNLDFGNFRQEAQWFKAKALLEINEFDQAKELLERIKAENKFYANDSKDLLKKIKQ